MSNSQNDKRVFIGFILILIGGFYLLRNFDLLPYFLPYYLFSWKVILILIGLFILTNRRNKTAGIILVGIGGFSLLSDVFNIHLHAGTIWPIILVAIGLSFIFRSKYDSREGFNVGSSTQSSADQINDFAFFGGGERIVTSGNFQGGHVTALFGGSEINLLNATLADGKNVLEVNAMFGGCSLVVPADWAIKTDVTSLFGGFSDKRTNISQAEINPQKELHIRGFVMFGGGEIKNYSRKNARI